LDGCEEIIAAASAEQLTSVWDLDLWRGVRPGTAETFDVDRFGEWLEVLARAGEEIAGRLIASIDEKLIIAGLSRYIRVFDPATLAAGAVDGAVMDVAMGHRGFECEVGGYSLHARRADAWDAIVALLLTLDAGIPNASTGSCVVVAVCLTRHPRSTA